MNAIKATWTNGQILPTEPVNWPDGSQLLVEPLVTRMELNGTNESEWGDDPESIAKWVAAVEKLQPLIWAEGEREAYELYREESRRFNIEAVRGQMDAMLEVNDS